MGMRLEEGVREGRLTKENTTAGNGKKYGNHFQKKKEQEVSMVAHGRPQPWHTGNQHVAAVQTTGYQPQFQQRPQQPYQPPQQGQQTTQQPQQNRTPRTVFDPIPMSYTELFPALLERNLIQTKAPPQIKDPLPSWWRADLSCAYHQGAPGHDLERCFGLKSDVQKLVRANLLTFKDTNPNVQVNPLPHHGPAVNMIQNDQEGGLIRNVQDLKTPLVPFHIKMCEASLFKHDHKACEICSADPRGCPGVQADMQGLLDRMVLVVSKREEDVAVIIPEFHIPAQFEATFNSQRSIAAPLVICPPGPMPYTSDKAIPYRYNATILEDGHEVPVTSLPSVDNITEDTRLLRNGRIIPVGYPKKVDAPPVKGPAVSPEVNKDTSQTVGAGISPDLDEVLKMIKKSDYKVVDQLMQTPAKISLMSLLLNSDAHREALTKVLDLAFVDHDVTVDQFGSIVGNITASNYLSFCDDELPEKGKNHNMALHISVNCGSDALSNVLVDTGSSLNVMPKKTLDQLAYRGTPLRRSGVVVKAFDGSRKSVIGEVDLPITIGPQVFQITFQVMDVQASYSCLLGRPWIHEAGAVSSTLHQCLKFVKNGKLVTVCGEEAFLISHLTDFSIISAGDAEGTPFQGLTIEEEPAKKTGTPISSLKDAQKAVQEGSSTGWGQVLDLPGNKSKEGLGFSPSAKSAKMPTTNGPAKVLFHSGGFIHPPSEANAIIEDGPEETTPSFVTPGGACHNWTIVNVPIVTPIFK